MRAAARAIVLASLVLGCEPNGQLEVDIRSDLVPGVELHTLSIELYESQPVDRSVSPYRRVRVQVDAEADYFGGVRAATLDGVPRGIRWLEVVAIDPDGRQLLRQPARVDVSARSGSIVLLDRQCRGVECPAAGGSPSALACLAGQCVDPDCNPSTPDRCPDWATCDRSSDCPTPAATCASAECNDGFCFSRVSGGSCGEGEWCNPEEDCLPLSGAVDGGVMMGGDACQPAFCDAGPCQIGVVECGSTACEVRGVRLDAGCGDGGQCTPEGTCGP